MFRAGVRRFLARGRLARLAACLVVAFAAVVWVAAASVVLRVFVVAALLLIAIWCVSLVVAVWVGEPADPDEFGESVWQLVLKRLRRAVAQAEAEPASPEDARAQSEVVSRGLTRENEQQGRRERELAEREAAFIAVRSSVDEVIADLLGRQERLNADGEQLQRELAGQIEAMRAVVARIAQLEPRVSLRARGGEPPLRERDPRPARHADALDPGASINADAHAVPGQPWPVEPEQPVRDHNAEFDLQAARVELEADLRLEKIEQREQMLGELEGRLRWREHQLADFVAEAQSQLNPPEPERQRPRLSASLQ